MDEVDCLNHLLQIYNKMLTSKNLDENEKAEYFFLVDNLQHRITKLEDEGL